MYICHECGKTFEEPKKVVETHGLDSPPYEKWLVCPHCKSADFGEAQECERCGRLCEELTEGLCNVCYEDMYYE